MLVGRDGVPHADVSFKPEASCSEWFDVTTGCWSVRDSSTGQVRTSESVAKVSARGVPLEPSAYKQKKEEKRRTLLQ